VQAPDSLELRRLALAVAEIVALADFALLRRKAITIDNAALGCADARNEVRDVTVAAAERRVRLDEERDDVDLAHDHAREVELPRCSVQPEEEHPTPTPHADGRRRRRVSRSACLDHDVEPDAVRELLQQARELLPRRVDHLVGTQRGGGDEPLRVDVDGDHTSVDHSTRSARDDEGADAANADDGDRLLRSLRDP